MNLTILTDFFLFALFLDQYEQFIFFFFYLER